MNPLRSIETTHGRRSLAPGLSQMVIAGLAACFVSFACLQAEEPEIAPTPGYTEFQGLPTTVAAPVPNVAEPAREAVESEGVKIPFTAVPVTVQKKARVPVAKVVPEAARVQQEKEALLEQATEKEVLDQREAEARFAAEQEQARALEQILKTARGGNWLKDSLLTLLKICGYAVLFLAALWFYFLPSHLGRRKRSATAIFVFNLLAGWTVIGWLIALVWARTKDLSAEPEFGDRFHGSTSEIS